MVWLEVHSVIKFWMSPWTSWNLSLKDSIGPILSTKDRDSSITTQNKCLQLWFQEFVTSDSWNSSPHDFNREEPWSENLSNLLQEVIHFTEWWVYFYDSEWTQRNFWGQEKQQNVSSVLGAPDPKTFSCVDYCRVVVRSGTLSWGWTSFPNGDSSKITWSVFDCRMRSQIRIIFFSFLNSFF